MHAASKGLTTARNVRLDALHQRVRAKEQAAAAGENSVARNAGVHLLTPQLVVPGRTRACEYRVRRRGRRQRVSAAEGSAGRIGQTESVPLDSGSRSQTVRRRCPEVHSHAGANEKEAKPVPEGFHQAQDSATQELRELCRSGLRVTWPVAGSLAPASCAVPRPATVEPPARCSDENVAQLIEDEAGEEEERLAALQELQALCRSGLRVRWPR